ncbi:unnamed protein product [Rangifer tarandus platyrhynchus]|uniref:Uncharacterized protein n=1 Tax=Rangifer tarandus platyrhynchus TaxID=3082113 RepID=A0ABN9A2A6_RANTA|nr:unnamed protein product [Rangifer tarandus platyrhynchus]
MQGGCWPGKGVTAHAWSRASRAAAPGRPPPLRSLSPSARCRPGAAAGEGARVRVCVCARVCAAGSLQHLCTEMRSSLCRRRSLAGWVSAWRRAPAPPFPSSPASPHLLPVFKGRAASSVRLGRFGSCAAWPLPPPFLPSPALKGWRGCEACSLARCGGDKLGTCAEGQGQRERGGQEKLFGERRNCGPRRAAATRCAPLRTAARTGAGGIVLTHKEGHAWQDTDRAQRQAEGSPPPRPSGRRTPSPGTGRVKKGFPEAGGRYDDSSPSTLPTELASSASAERCGGLRNDCSARSQSVS